MIIEEIFTFIGKCTLYIITGIIFILSNIKRLFSDIIIYIILGIVKLAERIYNINKVNYGICPECYYKFEEPVYVCPNCNIGYNSLMPSKKGIFSIKCSCSYKIPVTSWKKRKLKTLCPECCATVAKEDIPIIAIPVIGGEYSGKTTFINNLRLEMNVPVITDNPETSVLAFTENFGRKANQFMIFDAASNEFSSSDKLKKYKYYSYNDGFIFIIDPFITEKSYKNSSSAAAYMLVDILDTVILNLQKNHGLGPGETLDKPAALVITKMDLRRDKEEIISKGGESFLLEQGEELFLNKLKNIFTSYKFFTLDQNLNKDKSTEIIKWITEKTVHYTH